MLGIASKAVNPRWPRPPRRLRPMDARRWLLLSVGLAVVIGTIALALLSRPVRQLAADPQPAAPGMAPADVYALFTNPQPSRSLDDPVTVSVDAAPDVVLPSGRLVACDAFVIGALPFTFDVAAGRHAVSVLRTDFSSGDRRIAAAAVRLAPGDPVRWELALVAGQDPAVLRPGEVFGYGVDSGTGAFTSPEAIAALEAEADYAAYSDALLAAMPGKTMTDPLTAAVDVDQASGANVVAFASGFGDGSYPSYAGLDTDGRVVVVLTDFGILDAPKD